MSKEIVQAMIKADLEMAEAKRDEFQEKARKGEPGSFTLYCMYDAEARAYRNALEALKFL